MKAVLLTRTVVKLGFFIDISFDLKNIVNHDQATLYHHIQFELHEQQVLTLCAPKEQNKFASKM